jgi:hypothetical protein
MGHDQARPLLADAALDLLPGEELAAVLQHAASCAECGPALALLRDSTSQMAYAVPDVEGGQGRRDRVRARLLARARAEREAVGITERASAARAPGVVDPSGPRRPGVARSAVAVGSRRPWTRSAVAGWSVAAVLGLAAAVVVAVLEHRVEDRDRIVAEARARDSLAIARLEDTVAARDSTLRDLTGQEVSTLQLTSGAPRAPWAWMFWNHRTNHWTFVAHNLPAPPAGRTYQLWLVTPKAKVSPGTFSPAPDGSAHVEATYALASDSLRAIAVTEEPAGGVPQPTGPFVLSAGVNRQKSGG